MPSITIPAGEQFDFDVTAKGRNLLLRSVSKTVFLESDDFRGLILESGDAVDVGDYGEMRFINLHDVAITVSYQISDLNVINQAQQNVIIQRIIEPIQFEASVRVVDGLKVDPMSPSQLFTIADQTIEAGSTLKVSSERTNRKETAIQVISELETTLRIGNSSVNAGSGALLSGSIQNPAAFTVNSSAAVYVHNTSNTAATVAVLEVCE